MSSAGKHTYPHLLQTWQSLPVLPLSFPASRQIGIVSSDPAGSQRGEGEGLRGTPMSIYECEEVILNVPIGVLARVLLL